MNKIAFIRNSHNIGGIETQILSLAKFLHKNRLFSPYLITSIDDTFSKTFKRLGFQILYLNPSSIFDQAYQIKTLCTKNKIKIIQSHGFRESIIARTTKLLSPSLIHFFRVETYISCSNISIFKKKAYYFLDSITSFLVNQYVINGKYIKSEIKKNTFITSQKIKTLLNGMEKIGPEVFLDNNTKTPSQKKIAMIANFDKGKGHDTLFQALGILKSKGLTVETHLIGGGFNDNEKHDFSESSERLNQIITKNQLKADLVFHGFVKNIYPIIQDISIIVLPSDSEGIPNCILEGMSLKKLIIASDVGGIPEMIEHNKEGLLHLPKSPENFAELLELVFSKKETFWNPIRENAYKKWQKSFSFEAVMDQFISIYKTYDLI